MTGKNVLMIIADDLRPNLNSYLPTPSFRLSQEPPLKQIILNTYTLLAKGIYFLIHPSRDGLIMTESLLSALYRYSAVQG